MAKTRSEKEKIVQDLKNNLKKMKGLAFVNFSGLKVKEVNQLRRLLKQQGGQYLVAKKTLLKMAFKNSDLEKINSEQITGGLGLVFAFIDEMTPIKILANFTKDHPNLIIQGGIFNQEFIGPEIVKGLASLPSKEQLLIKLIWTIKSPINNLTYVLKGNLRSFVYILNQIKSKNYG